MAKVMIISHKHKFIFLKTKKTAGTSIECALSAICGPDDVITPIIEEDEIYRQGYGPQNWRVHSRFQSRRPWYKIEWLNDNPRDLGYYNHMPANEANALTDQDIWDSYFKFCFDRNPWDRQVSAYLFVEKRKSDSLKRGGIYSFYDYITKSKKSYINNYDIYSINGDVAVDFVGRYENLEEDLDHVLRRLGIEHCPELPHAKSWTRARKGRHDYRRFYTNETRQRVAGWYAREIALMGYEF